MEDQPGSADRRGKIVELLKQSKPARKPATGRQAVGHVIRVAGNGNVVAAGDVNLMPVLRPRVVVKTGDGVIDASQRAELQRLVHDWVEARTAVRKSSSSYAAAWGALNRHFGISGYAELPMEQFGEARQWLARQVGIVHSMASAPKKVSGWRHRTQDSIKARCRNQLGDEAFYRPYIERKFAKSSLRDLTDDELQRVKQYVFNAKPRGGERP